MKIIPDGPGTLRAVMETLVRLPEPVRAFALERVAIFVHGVTSLGSSIDTATALEGRDWLVNVTAYAGLQETLMHELAHSWLAHRGTPTADYEREASALAASWGARGSGADPDWGVANFRQWIAPTPRARTTDDIISSRKMVIGGIAAGRATCCESGGSVNRRPMIAESGTSAARPMKPAKSDIGQRSPGRGFARRFARRAADVERGQPAPFR